MQMDSILFIFSIITLEASNCLSLLEIHHVKILRILEPFILLQRDGHLMDPFLVNASEPIDQLCDFSIQILDLNFVRNTCFLGCSFHIVFHYLFSLGHYPV